MTRADIRLLAFLVFATLVAMPASLFASSVGGHTATINGPAGETVVDLDVDAEYRVVGLEGEVVFSVDGGRLLCVSSCCDSQVCVRTHQVSPGRPVVCVPNAVTAMLISDDGGGYDAISR